MINSVDRTLKPIFYIFFVIIFIIGIMSFLIFDSGYENLKLLKNQYNTCNVYLNSSDSKKESLVQEYNDYFELSNESCNEIVKYNVSPGSAFFVYENIIYSSFLSIFIPFFIPILLIFPCIYIITKKYRSNEIKNYLLRDNYENYKKKIIKIAYNNILIIPFVLCIIFIVSLLISKNINPISDINFSLVQPNLISRYNNIIFYILYFLVIILNVGMYDNIALIVSSRNKNFLISYIESFLLIYIIWCISEIFFGNIFQLLFNISASNFSLLDIYRWVGVNQPLVFLFVSAFWFILSLLAMIYCYKDKEKIIEMCER